MGSAVRQTADLGCGICQLLGQRLQITNGYRLRSLRLLRGTRLALRAASVPWNVTRQVPRIRIGGAERSLQVEGVGRVRDASPSPHTEGRSFPSQPHRNPGFHSPEPNGTGLGSVRGPDLSISGLPNTPSLGLHSRRRAVHGRSISPGHACTRRVTTELPAPRRCRGAPSQPAPPISIRLAVKMWSDVVWPRELYRRPVRKLSTVIRNWPFWMGRTFPTKSSRIVAIPESEVALVRQLLDAFCDRVPAHARAEVSYEWRIRGNQVTLGEKRAAWWDEDGSAEPTVDEFARFQYDPLDKSWQLKWRDRNGRFHPYEGMERVRSFARLVEEVDADPTCIFFG